MGKVVVGFKGKKDEDRSDKLKSLLINNIIATRIIITSKVEEPGLQPRVITIFL